MAFPISACMDPYPLPISSLYSPYILSNIILVSSLCPSVFSLSFSISSLYRLYLFQYHPCILPILANIILVSSLSFPISSLYRHSSHISFSLYPSRPLSISNPIPPPSSYILHKFVPVFFTTFSLYPCQYHLCIFLILVYIYVYFFTLFF